MKKILLSVITTAILSTSTISLAANNEINVMVSNKPVNFNQLHNNKPVGKPFIQNNRTFIPLRVVSEDLGYDVEWDGPTQTVSVSKDSNEVKIKIGESFATINGYKAYIDVQDGKPVNTKVQLKDSRTYVPVRFISEAMGDSVDFRKPSNSSVKVPTVYINSVNLPEERPEKPAPIKPTPSKPKPTPSPLPSIPAPNNSGFSIPPSAKFTKKDPLADIWVYDYNINLATKGKIYEVLVSKEYKDLSVMFLGHDNNNRDFIGEYANGRVQFMFEEPTLTPQDYSIISREMARFLMKN